MSVDYDAYSSPFFVTKRPTNQAPASDKKELPAVPKPEVGNKTARRAIKYDNETKENFAVPHTPKTPKVKKVPKSPQSVQKRPKTPPMSNILTLSYDENGKKDREIWNLLKFGA